MQAYQDIGQRFIIPSQAAEPRRQFARRPFRFVVRRFSASAARPLLPGSAPASLGADPATSPLPPGSDPPLPRRGRPAEAAPRLRRIERHHRAGWRGPRPSGCVATAHCLLRPAQRAINPAATRRDRKPRQPAELLHNAPQALLKGRVFAPIRRELVQLGQLGEAGASHFPAFSWHRLRMLPDIPTGPN